MKERCHLRQSDNHRCETIVKCYYITLENVGLIAVFSFAHLGDGKTLGLLTNVTDGEDNYHFRQTGVLYRCTRQLYWTGVLDRCTTSRPYRPPT